MASTSFNVHAPNQGFLYFPAGCCAWQPATDGTLDWLLRVDVCHQAPQFFRVRSAPSALRMATQLAEAFAAGIRAELDVLHSCADGTELHGILPTAAQHADKPQHAESHAKHFNA